MEEARPGRARSDPCSMCEEVSTPRSLGHGQAFACGCPGPPEPSPCCCMAWLLAERPPSCQAQMQTSPSPQLSSHPAPCLPPATGAVPRCASALPRTGKTASTDPLLCLIETAPHACFLFLPSFLRSSSPFSLCPFSPR